MVRDFFVFFLVNSVMKWEEFNLKFLDDFPICIYIYMLCNSKLHGWDD